VELKLIKWGWHEINYIRLFDSLFNAEVFGSILSVAGVVAFLKWWAEQ
jgi:hypothetical protein